MFSLLKMIWNSILAVGRMIFLPVTTLRKHKELGTVTRWTVHVLAVIGIIVALGLLNHLLGFDRLVRAPLTAMRKIWLPLMFLQIYVLSWLGWWLARLLNDPGAPSPFPDIDAAWDAAMDELAAGGIRLQDTPVYLILGQTTNTYRNFFGAARLPLTVRQAPLDPSAPLHVSANADAIYISCAGASLLGELDLGLPTTEARLSSDNSGTGEDASNSGTQDSLPGFWTGKTPTKPVRGTLELSAVQLESNVALLEPESAQRPSAKRKPSAAAEASEPERGRTVLRKSADDIALATSRLRHLCNLLSSRRRPYCPINGVLVLLPFAAANSEVAANQAGAFLERDLEVLRDSLEVQCPLFVMVCDLEHVPGCRELLQRFPEEQRHRRLGLKLPPVPLSEIEQRPAMIEEAVEWICTKLTPTLVLRLLQVDRAGQEAEDQQLNGNSRLYDFLYQLRERHHLLARAVCRCVRGSGGRTWQFGGCFLGATGNDRQAEQGFVSGLFPSINELQDCVSWAPNALVEDARARRYSRLGYTGIGVATIVLLMALLYAF